LNRIRSPKEIGAVAELVVPIGATMVRYGFKQISTFSRNPNLTETVVFPDVKFNQATVKRIFDFNNKEVPANCECFDADEHWSHFAIKFQKGSTVHSYRNDMNEYNPGSTDELSGTFVKK
jgi:hypothetical protein